MPETQKSLSGGQACENKVLETDYTNCSDGSASADFRQSKEINHLLDAALSYARRGWPVLPCHGPLENGECSCRKPNCPSIGKHPRTQNGVKDATTDETIIRQWWRQWPMANVAIATGNVSGLVVLDIDPRHGGDESLAQLKSEIAGFPDTLGIITGSGGQHLYFVQPSQPIKNRVGFRPGLDLKTDGGFVIAPPSLHVSGSRYIWEASHQADVIQLAALPDAMLKAIRDSASPNSKVGSLENTDDSVPAGERNNSVFQETCRLLRKGLSEAETTALILHFNQTRCEPPLPEDEVLKIIHSALNYHPPTAEDELPSVITNGMQRREVSRQAIESLVQANQKKLSLFVRGNALVRVRALGKSGPVIDPVSDNILEHALSRSANWYTITQQGERKASQCPAKVIRDILAETDWPFPPLEGISRIPLFTLSGQLQTTPGYDAQTGYWLDLSNDIEVGEISERAVLEAVNLIFNDLLADFPFKDEASRAHALAALILPFVRPLIDEPTPLHLFDASSPGSGKSLLASIIALVVTGREPAMMTEGGSADEWRKKLTAVLIEAPSVLVVDNISKKLDSGDLAAALTTNLWADRILGKSEIVRVPVKTLWLATGNNVRLSHEMARRIVWCRLQPEEERPWERRQFRHSNIKRWVREHRLQLIQAILILIRHWFGLGQPAGPESLGSYEQWAAVVGGILHSAGIQGFLENREALYEDLDEEAQQWGAFVALWWEQNQNQPVSVKDLLTLAASTESLSELLGHGNEQSRKTSLGKALSSIRDRVVDGFRICVSAKGSRNGAKLYYLKPTNAS